MNRRALEDIVGAENIGQHARLPDVPVARPADVEQARELLLLAGKDELRLLFLGQGSKLGWANLAATPDFALSTTRLCGVTEFEPGDGTLTTLAGTSMDELSRITNAEGLCVTPDVARPASTTLGGTMAAGASGADRMVHGAGRLHVLGTRVLQMNGERTRSGGKLVKNVSGYDLHRLYCGSFGSLALILEASLRLAFAAQSTWVLTQRFDDLEPALRTATDVLAARIAPHALTVENQIHADEWGLHVVLAGRDPHLEHLHDRLRTVLGDFELERGHPAVELARRLRDLEPDSRERPYLHVTAQPSALRLAVGELFDVIGEHSHAQVLVQPGIATVDFALEPGAFEAPHETLGKLRSALKPLSAAATWRAAAPLGPEFVAPVADPLRTGLMQRLRATYDPQDLLCTRPPLGGLQ